MKAYYLPFQGGKCAAFSGSEGYRLKGPILFVPEKGAIFYETSFTGDAECGGLVTNGVDFFEGRGLLLEQIAMQMQGKIHPHVADIYHGEKFDLSQGVKEVEIPEQVFEEIAKQSNIAYIALEKFKSEAFKLVFGLERKLHRDKKQK